MSFTTGQISVVPPIPVMISPANSATGLLAQVLFSWALSYQADSYELEVATDNYFTQTIVNQENLTDTSYQAEHLLPNTHYFWRIRAHNVAGYSNFTVIRNFTTGNFTANDDQNNPIITKNDLYPNYPNPFNPETTLSFDLKERQYVTLEIYNIRGQKVTTLAQESMDAGNHRVLWKGTDSIGKKVSTGMYFSRLSIGGETFSRKMLLLK
jgi:hypothetical protein